MKAKLSLTATIFCCLFTIVFACAPRSVASTLPQYQSETQTITCSSDDMGRHTCEIDAPGGAQLIRQISGSPCILGRTWGYDAHGIWVDRGCRAEFQVGSASWNGWDNGNTIYCASDEGDRHFCPARVSNGVRLTRQRRGSECVFGRTWGYNRRGIWVDQGCRADFELGTASNSGSTQTVSCSSDDMRWHACQADTSSGVRLLRQRSEADCIYGTTWGYDDRGIWVDRGCRADFEIGGDQYDEEDQQYNVNVSCSSDDMHRHFCYAGAHGGVRLVKRRSEAECIEGRTWGREPRGIWVDHGCRADFEVAVGGFSNGGNHGADSSSGTVTSLNCSSEDGKRHYCSADTRWGVRLVKQRSGSPCTQNSTWGYDNNGVWVDRGCRADFEIAVGRSSNGRNHGPDWSNGTVTPLNCSSEDGKRHYCAAETRWGVRLVKQRSGSPCAQNGTWGYDSNGVWVDRGCRADFEVLSPRH
ncbi:MAG TPA: DUF3011 domain-containing protein [Candidatus Sulfotelmatobacter sp.]|jgi:hypothetical protein|nr:DUF3011 domain-containing protein [Candidatus Sulfotelmatobacter sp.]